MKKISFKGVIIGSILDIVASNVIGFFLVFYLTLAHKLPAVPKDQLSAALMQLLHEDPVLFSAWTLLGSLCSILGGYVAAHIAGRHELLNGALSSFLCVGSGLYTLLFGTLSAPLWEYGLIIIASPAVSAIGGYIALRITPKTAVA